MTALWIWTQFLICAGLILISGSRLSKYGDVIAEKTGLGRNWVGVVLLATVTSLPELFTGASSVLFYDLPDIAIGNVLGACMLNMLILVVLDDLIKDKPILALASRGHLISAFFCIAVIGLVYLQLLLPNKSPSLGWFSWGNMLIFATYAFAMKVIFDRESGKNAEALEEGYAHIPASRAYKLYILNAVVIIACACYLPGLADQIAEMTGLGETFVGSVFIALTTNLPELTVSVSAVRLGAVDMALGNLLGSNLFNVGILVFLDDLLYQSGPILNFLAPGSGILCLAAILMVLVVVLGLCLPPKRQVLRLGWPSWVILTIYLVSTYMLYQAI